MLCETTKSFIMLAERSSRLIESLGIISKAVVLFTNLMRKFQSSNRSLVIMLKRITPNLVPCKILPLSCFYSDKTPSILPVRKADIQPNNASGIFNFSSSEIKIL